MEVKKTKKIGISLGLFRYAVEVEIMIMILGENFVLLHFPDNLLNLFFGQSLTFQDFLQCHVFCTFLFQI